MFDPLLLSLFVDDIGLPEDETTMPTPADVVADSMDTEVCEN